MKKNDKYLITGGTGSIGKELIKTLVNNGYKNIRVLARNEGQLVGLQNLFPIEIVMGNIADNFICEKACQNINGIFHLSAYKHVSLAETNVYSCIESNIIGTSNLLLQSIIKKPSFFVFVSTDKAINVKGVYSATKLLGEKLVEEFSTINNLTKYRIVRFGNVWDTTGSFIRKWKSLTEQNKPIILTDPKATRFFISKKEAVTYIFDCLKNNSVAPFIPKNIKGVEMGKVFEWYQEIYGKQSVNIVGLQNGENLHETIDGVDFSNSVPQFTKKEFIEKFLR